MSQNQETPILVSSLLITIGLIVGGVWWLTKSSGSQLNKIIQSQPNNSISDTTNTIQNTPAQLNIKTFATVQDVPKGLFNYGGSTTWAPIRLIVDPKIQASQPGFRLRYVQPPKASPGSGTGIQSLIDGQLTFSQSSRPIKDEELSRAQQRGFSLEQIPVAIDGLAIAVNSNLNIPGLTIEQIKSIYTGKIRNWSQVGGPNIPIKAYSRRLSDAGTVELFVQDIMDGQDFSPQVEFIPTTTQALQEVARDPGGIYYASAPEIVPQCTIKPLPIGQKQGQYIPPYIEPLVTHSECPNKRNQLNIEAFQTGKYPITRNLFVIIKQNNQIEQQVGKTYANFLLTEQGQELISQAGYVKIR